MPKMLSSKGGDTDVSATVSNGAADKNISEKADSPPAIDSSPFEEGEKVLAYHGPCLYDAKVQRVEHRMNLWRYYVHYPGWNKNWDEWVDIDRLLKHTEENVQKQKELLKQHKMEKNAKPARVAQAKSTRGSRKRKHDFVKENSADPLEKLVNIQIPLPLKKQLVDDYESITQLGQLVKLPRSPNVFEILNDYFDYRVKKDGKIADSLGEVVGGLRCYFDKALPAMLLYKNERKQYQDAIAENVSPSNIYGAEHLLRLFVKLPEMLSKVDVEVETLVDLQQKLVDLLKFLQSNQSVLFLSSYQTQSSDSTVDKEDN